MFRNELLRLTVFYIASLLTRGQVVKSDERFDSESIVFTNQWAVHVVGGDRAAEEVALRHGFTNLGKILGDFYHFQHSKTAKRSTESSFAYHHLLSTDPKVRWAQQQTVKRRIKRRLRTSNDSSRRIKKETRSFYYDFNDPGWIHMWYLNRGNGRDMNVQEAWSEGITGKGSVVTILDDGLEKNHPDILQNYDPMASFDVNDQDEDPSPRYDSTDSNRHGTRCAGEVAAQGNNSICSVGIAFNAKIGGVRMLDGDVTDAVEARSLSYNSQYIDIYSASWGPDDDGKTVDGPGELATRAFINGVVKGRDGKGSIFVWASGNGGREYDNCNCDGYTNSIWTLSISSVTENGSVPWYSESCSSTLAAAYSSGAISEKQIVTTDLHHSCTPSHTGTSAAAPLAAGICALTLEANRNLTWRDMQHIVIRTARPGPLFANDWQINGAGRNVSHSFGYGLMDAAAMVRLARRWTSVTPQHFCRIRAPTSHKSSIPPKQSITLQLQLSDQDCSEVNVIEHLQVLVSLTAMNRGDIEIRLSSPAGTISTLLSRRPLDTSQNGFHSWPFMSVHFWDESPVGIWTIEIQNRGQFSATFIDWTLVVYGTKNLKEEKKFKSATIMSTIQAQRPVLVAQNKSVSPQNITQTNGGLALNRVLSVLSPFKNLEHNKAAELSLPNFQLPQALKLISSNISRVCEIGFYLWKDTCINTCPNTSHPQNRTELNGHLSGVCVPCHYSCFLCSGPSDSDCTSCYPDSDLKSVVTPGSFINSEKYCYPRELIKQLTGYENWSVGVQLGLAVNLALVAVLVGYMLCGKKSCNLPLTYSEIENDGAFSSFAPLQSAKENSHDSSSMISFTTVQTN